MNDDSNFYIPNLPAGENNTCVPSTRFSKRTYSSFPRRHIEVGTAIQYQNQIKTEFNAARMVGKRKKKKMRLRKDSFAVLARTREDEIMSSQRIYKSNISNVTTYFRNDLLDVRTYVLVAYIYIYARICMYMRWGASS